MNWLYGSFLVLLTPELVWPSSVLKSPWRYECVKGYCQKRPITNENEGTALSLAACRLFCADAAAIWPKPSGNVSIGNFLTTINVHSIDILGAKYDSPTFDLVRGASRIFRKQIEQILPRNVNLKGGKSLIVTLDIKDSGIDKHSLELDESYQLKINETSDGRVEARVTSQNFFGARHGLETLNQLIIFDDLRDELQIARDVFITDKPAYPYRGVLLDTSRNFITVEAIKTTLTAMGAAKLNTFHWHITDSHSFPYVSKSRPELAKYGAYSPEKIYSPADVREIIEYGKLRGVRVLPEFDAPAHVGEGWQHTNLVTCFNWQPWQSYCVEPPCGQFDVTKDKLYDVIEDIYGDMFDQFQPDIFHMGGDEVNFNCWNNTESIVKWMEQKGWGRTEADFIKLWDYFQSKALERVYKKAGRKIPVVMWTSHLTHKEYLTDFLPKDKYIVQIWTLGNDPQVKNLLENGYKVILSNYDALYLDCGFAGWVTDGNNWCSPYIGWQKVYENKPIKIAGSKRSQVLGAEATFWTEQADSTSLDSRLWPRSSAMAEVLWSEPETGWREAESRFLIHRERLVKLGVNADALEPEWCMQYEENCPIGGIFNVDNKPKTDIDIK
ncbi:chitooligosaccharidolytic beta-N-acetylglucosaminidase isoform X2 [Anthonomus grandis grandis]|nr:chitooligosaccharidolytic beta-N-acetylglucosaminidase isoform X2 [Anthonomus grandis grandis]XP_050299652.1 chitooligosaccharidolytic beta-N-acetylglucosaminidase isoform X2 [Anthonomus grandis grandis]